MMRILFIVGRLRFGSREQGKSHREGRPLTFRARARDLAIMQFDAALDDDQPQPGARELADVASTMEGGEKLLLVGHWNADALVPHPEDRLAVVAFQGKLDGCGFSRI